MVFWESLIVCWGEAAIGFFGLFFWCCFCFVWLLSYFCCLNRNRTALFGHLRKQETGLCLLRYFCCSFWRICILLVSDVVYLKENRWNGCLCWFDSVPYICHSSCEIVIYNFLGERNSRSLVRSALLTCLETTLIIQSRAEPQKIGSAQSD